MPPPSVPATAEGMPALSRRALLLGLATASTTAAAVAITATAAAPAENPELVRLGDVLPAVEAEYGRVRDHQDAIKGEWAQQWPTAPKEIAGGERGGYYERNFYGALQNRHLVFAYEVEWRITRAERALRSRATKRPWHSFMSRQEWQAELEEAKRVHALALHHEAEIKRIHFGSNWTGCWQATRDATKQLAEHVAATMAQPDETVAGLLIKAEALAAWGQVEPDDQRWAYNTPNEWHGEIARSVLRHAKQGAA